jgi:V8-like Glu-specific endopeptidase
MEELLQSNAQNGISKRQCKGHHCSSLALLQHPTILANRHCLQTHSSHESSDAFS